MMIVYKIEIDNYSAVERTANVELIRGERKASKRVAHEAEARESSVPVVSGQTIFSSPAKVNG
jgi:hypothetical protein